MRDIVHIAEFSVKNSVMINLIMVAILVIGLMSAFTLPLELFPSIQMEMVNILTQYPGASAEDVEQLVSIPIEDEINDLTGVKVVRSVSSEGLSTVIAELEAGEDVSKISEDIRSKISQIQNHLPTDAEPPIVREIEAEFPLINVSIAGNVPKSVLRQYALRLRDELMLIPGVGNLWDAGLSDPVFWVKVRPEKLRQLNLSIEQVARAIQLKNLDLPGGSFEQGKVEFLVRTQGRIHTPDDLLSIPVRRNPTGRHIYIRDIGTVELGTAKNTSQSRINGLPAITFYILKQKNVDDIDTVRRIRKAVAQFQSRLPKNMQIYDANDTSHWVRDRFHTMVNSGITGLIIVLLILAVFLDIRSATMAALGLPVAFLGAILLMHLTGITLNVLSMFGLILVLGIIVDDAIIVVENIQRYITQGLSPRDAAIRGTKEVTQPVLATVTTNIAALIPLLTASGLIGKFISTIPKVAIYAMTVSLFEALFILPSHCADMLKPLPNHRQARNWLYRLRYRYMKSLAFVIRHRYISVITFFIILIISIGVLSRIPFSMFYTRDIANFNIRVENPTWSDLSATEESVKQVEAVVRKVIPAHALKNIVVMLGLEISRREPEWGDHLATIMVEYEDFSKRKENGVELMNQVRKELRNVVGPTRFEVIKTSGPPTGRPVDVRIQGRDFKTLKEIASRVEGNIEKIPGVYAISDDLVWGKPEIRLQVNEARAAMYGLDTTTVARAVRAAVDGLTVTRTRLGKEEADVIVRYELPPGDVSTLLAAARIPAPNGAWIPLNQLVEMNIGPSMLRISRYDMERAVRVTAEVDQKITTARIVNHHVRDELDRILSGFPGYSYAFGGEEEETQRSIRSIFQAMVIAIVLIYAILASVLRSYTQPLIIISIMPFGIIGVAIGILIRGEPFSFPALIGTLALLGIIVNDSLILTDFINQRRKDLHRITSVFYAAKYRFRPVLLTTLTTFGGLASLMVKTRGEAAFLAPMAMALGFGLLFATWITLYLIPSLYLILDDTKIRITQVSSAIKRNLFPSQHLDTPRPSVREHETEQ